MEMAAHLSGHFLMWFQLSGGRIQRLIQIRNDIRHIFGANRQAYHIRGRARHHLLLFTQLTVGGRGRVDDQRAGVAKVGHMLNSFRLSTSLVQAS